MYHPEKMVAIDGKVVAVFPGKPDPGWETRPLST